MTRSKYINTFDTTAEYNNYIESALPAFPNVGYDKEADKVNIRRQPPNDYQIWGTTTATENFNVGLNYKNVEITVDRIVGEFYLKGWTNKLTALAKGFNGAPITSFKKLSIDTTNVTSLSDSYSGGFFENCSSLTTVNLNGHTFEKVTKAVKLFNNCRSLKTIYLQDADFSNVTNKSSMFYGCDSLTDVYINVEGTLMKLTNNLTSQGNDYIPSTATIHYNDVDYKWTGSAWTQQS